MAAPEIDSTLRKILLLKEGYKKHFDRFVNPFNINNRHKYKSGNIPELLIVPGGVLAGLADEAEDLALQVQQHKSSWPLV